MIQIIYYILFTITLLYGLYFVITGLPALYFSKKNKIKKSKPKYKFAVLIAARNEQEVIGSLVDSLNKQNYPKELYTTYVIVNNCTDNTADVAKLKGATIINPTIKVKTKGDVLKYTFEKMIKENDMDAFIIFDADNVVDPNFISRMNDTLCAGYNVAEGFRDSKNLADNWLSGSYSLFYYIQNFFFNRARMIMNLSGSINGTGFMVKKEVIEKHGFNPKTLTEDIEFTAMCALNGEKIAFVEDAITYDEQPTKFNDSWKQRKRWSTGTLQCMRHYNGKLLYHFFKDKNMSCLDMFMTFLAPIMQVLALILTILLTVFSIVGIKLYDIFSYMLSYGIIFFIAVYIIGLIVNVCIFKYNKKKVLNIISSVFLFTVFMLTWLPINIVCMIKKNTKWEPIKHNRNVDVNELIQ